METIDNEKFAFNEKQRFTDFIKSIPAISKKVLTDNLRALENDGIIIRAVFAEVPLRFGTRKNFKTYFRRNVGVWNGL